MLAKSQISFGQLPILLFDKLRTTRLLIENTAVGISCNSKSLKGSLSVVRAATRNCKYCRIFSTEPLARMSHGGDSSTSASTVRFFNAVRVPSSGGRVRMGLRETRRSFRSISLETEAGSVLN